MRPVVLSLLAVMTIAALFGGCAGTGGNWNTFDLPNDPDYLYATGTAESQALQIAIDKATMNARAEIGRMLELKLNGLQKSFAEEVGTNDTELNQFFSQTTKTIVSTQLVGSKIRESKYKEKDGTYQSVVVVEYPIGAANAALVEQIKKNENMYTRFLASESFKELESEVEKYEKLKSQGQN